MKDVCGARISKIRTKKSEQAFCIEAWRSVLCHGMVAKDALYTYVLDKCERMTSF